MQLRVQNFGGLGFRLRDLGLRVWGLGLALVRLDGLNQLWQSPSTHNSKDFLMFFPVAVSDSLNV